MGWFHVSARRSGTARRSLVVRSATTLTLVCLTFAGWSSTAQAANLIRLPEASAAGSSTALSARASLPTAAVPKATATGVSGQVKLSWKAVKAPSGKTVTYQIKRSPGNVTVTTKALSRTFSGLHNGTSYTFRVRAKLSATVGAWSVASAKATPFRRASAPKQVKVGPEPGGRTEYYGYSFLRWCPATAHTYPVDHYEYRIDFGAWKAGGDPNTYEYPTGSPCLMTIDVVFKFGKHTFMVRAVDSKGHKGDTATVTMSIPKTSLALGWTAVDPTDACSENCFTPTATITNNYFPSGSTVQLTVNGSVVCSVNGPPAGNGTVVLTDSLRSDNFQPCVVTSGDTVVGTVSTLFGQTVARSATVPLP